MMQKFLPSIRLGCVLLISTLLGLQAFAQEKTLTGKVTSSEDGSPLPGVNISIKGTAQGTTTDADGNYSITIPADAALVFSQVGMISQEITVGSRTVINVILMVSTEALDEVVVTALGIKQERRALGYAVTEVKGKEIAETQRNNFLIGLQGRVPGLTLTTTSGQPGASAAVVLRGANSIGGNNSPLYVIDGLPVDNRTFGQGALVTDGPNRGNDYLNRIADINPNDIESITVLKGMEAAALYGLDASGGAIIITTKKGTQGKGKITYDNSFRFEKNYRFLDIQKTFNRGLNGITDAQNQTVFMGGRYSDNKIYDNVKNFYQTGFTQNHNIGLEGGNEKITYRFSTMYTDQKGTVPNTNFQKLSVKLSSTAKITPKLEVSTSFNFVKNQIAKALRSDGGYFTGLYAWPSNEDITNYLNPDGTRRRLLSISTEPDNPLYQLNKMANTDRTSRIIGNMSLTYKPLEWLDLTGRIGADVYSTLGNLFTHPEQRAGIGTRGSIDNYTENSQLLNGMFLATAKKTFGKWGTSLLLGSTFDDRRYEVNAIYGEKLFLNDFNSINNTDPTTQRNKLTLTRSRLVSVLGSLDISYADLFFLKITGRNDWSSTLPVANNRFFYPSVSASFVFTEMPVLKDKFSFLTFGKLRASYAEVGKDATPYRVRSSLTAQTTTGGGFGYGFFGGNEALTPERGRGFEIGGEIRFLQNRVGLDVAYYKNERSKQIVSQRLSYGTGFIFGLLNGGTFLNEGAEISLNVFPVKNQNVTWEVILNYTKFKVYVQELPAQVAEYYNSDTWLYANARASAFPANVFKFYEGTNLFYNTRGMGSAYAIGGYSYLRSNKGDVLINPSTGLPIINQNFLPIGDRTPDFALGINNQFNFKGVNLGFLLDIRRGGDVFNGNELFLFRNGLSTRTLDREQPRVFTGVLRDGRENTDNPTVNTIQVTPQTRGTEYYNAIPESEFVEKSINWLRLRDITLGYQLPASWLSRTKVFRAASIYVNGTDLFLLTNYTGVDPNVNGTTATSGGVGAAGFDYGTLSMPRSVSLGIRLTVQ